MRSLLNLDHYPVSDADFRAECRATLDAEGALVLADFFTTELLAAVLADVDGRADQAFYARSTHNIWLTPSEPALGVEHIFNHQILSTKGLLADDQLSASSPLRTIYQSDVFRQFIAAVVDVHELYAYADELSSINVHFHEDGQELGWHFDNSSFAVTALIRAPTAGGDFEYVPNLRSAEADNQNFEGVAHAIATRQGVRQLDFGEGDLVLFRGRNSMHRVTPSRGDTTRVLVVFAWNDEPGIGLSDSAKQTFYGRLG